MDNDTDLLETNRFIQLNIVDQDVSFLNTSDRYIDFLKKTGRKKTVQETLDDDLLALDNADDDFEEVGEGDVVPTDISKASSFSHTIDTIFSIDSRFRDISSYPNAYSKQIFLEREFTFLDLIELIDIEIPYVPDPMFNSTRYNIGMSELSSNTTPVPYLFMRLKIESFPDNILNNITAPSNTRTTSTPTFLETQNNTISKFAKIGLSYRNNQSRVYNRIIYGRKDFNDTLSVVRAASAIRIDILGMGGQPLDSRGIADDGTFHPNPDFDNFSYNNWNLTIRFTERIQLLKSLNVNSIRSVNVDPRST